jgi:putative DNA primase/helicase
MATGSDAIRARFMRQDFFTFVPEFTLIISGNNRPGFRNVGEAIRRRVHLVPFRVVIPKAERVPDLDELLIAEEGPAILRWCVEGARAWLREGLRPPEGVLAASQEYCDSEDTLGQWIADCCDVRRGDSSSTKELYESFSTWAGGQGIPAWSVVAFGRALSDRGFDGKRTNRGKGFSGIAVRPPLLLRVPDVPDAALSPAVVNRRAQTKTHSKRDIQPLGDESKKTDSYTGIIAYPAHPAPIKSMG